MVVKRGKRWFIISHKTGKILGRKEGYATKEEALKFLHYIESQSKSTLKKSTRRGRKRR